MHDFRIKFYLSPASNRQKGTRVVHVRIYLDCQRDFLTSTKVIVPEDKWNPRQEQVMLDTPEARLMNHRLAIIRKTITNIYLQHENDDVLSIAVIKQAYHVHVKDRQHIEGACAFFRQYIKENEEAISNDAFFRYSQMTTLFGQYIASTYNVSDIDFTNIDEALLHNFENYLRVQKGYDHERTLRNKVYVLKAMFGAAMELGMIEHDPFDDYTSPSVKSSKSKSLTIDDIKLLKKVAFNTRRLDKVRDFFLFSCHTGLSYKDMRTLSQDHLERVNGKTWLIISGATETIPRYIPLLPYPLFIIEKYRTDKPKSPLLPLISQQKINHYLKEVADICGISKPITFRIAVMSFMKIALAAEVSTDCLFHIIGKSMPEILPSMYLSPERIEKEMKKFAIRIGEDLSSVK